MEIFKLNCMISLITAREFRVVLQELEEELGDISQDVQHLQKFSVDAISVEARIYNETIYQTRY